MKNIFAIFFLFSFFSLHAQKNVIDTLKTEELQEVEVNAKRKKINLGFHKKKVKYSSTNYLDFSKCALFIPSPNIEKSHFITKICIPIPKKIATTTGICHIQLYKKSSTGAPGESFLKNKIVVNIDTITGKLISVDIRNQQLFLPNEGIFVGLEWPSEGEQPKKITSNKQVQGPGFSYVFTTTEMLTWWSDIRTGYEWQLLDRKIAFAEAYYDENTVLNKKKNHPNINYGIVVEVF